MADAWVYLLRCADGSLYTGWTNDLPKRMSAHAAGSASRYTRSRLPVELALALPQPDRSSAMKEEVRIKRLSRAEKVALVAGGDLPPGGVPGGPGGTAPMRTC